ncbi:MAG: hypothetical protein KDC38_11205 [Planctomycetes bacterium]|nr:hypothetical protein [Planctomycetota bacterium]
MLGVGDDSTPLARGLPALLVIGVLIYAIAEQEWDGLAYVVGILLLIKVLRSGRYE